MFYFCTAFEIKCWKDPIAQLVEQRPFKAWALGSNPSRITIVS